MFQPIRRLLRGALAAALSLVFLAPPVPAATPRVHAIVGARIVTAPGQVIENGTVVMRDGVITAVGAGIAVPADARIWEGDSLTVYPGLIDPYVMVDEPAPPPRGPGRPTPAPPAPSRGAAHEVASVRSEIRISETSPLTKEQAESLRAAGFAAVQVTPRAGIVRGQSAVVGLRSGEPNDIIIKADAAQVVALQAAPSGYPGSLMGAIAVIRQAFMDAKWYRDALAVYARAPQGKERPEVNLSWAALQPVIAGQQPVLFVADEMLEVVRATALAREAGVTAQILGAGDEYKRVKEIAASGVPLIVPVSFPEAPDLADADAAVDVSTEELRHWNQAPANPATLAQNGVAFALTANGLKDVKSFRANVGKAIERGLTRDQALAAMTTTPARLLGLGDRLGVIAPGRMAYLTVTRGDLFSEQGKVAEVWVDGDHYDVSGAAGSNTKGNWTLTWGQGGPGRHTLMVDADKDTTVKLVVGADTLKATGVRYDGARIVFTVQRGSEPAETFDLTARHDVLHGTLAARAGSHRVLGVKQAEADKGGAKKGEGSEGKMAAKDEPVVTPVVMGNTEAWRMSAPAAPAAVLVRNATVWTAGPEGTLQNADLLVRGGKIAAVGKGLTAPAGAVVIDGTGKHVAPGIIDEHSHSAGLGNINECTNSVTCEVRLSDIINSESINIYRQLAGGTTIMHMLHGSCNAIGGQCAVLKNKWGEPPDRLLMANVAPTVKFALGENPKQSNWGADRPNPPRYPQSRAGVEQVIRDAFIRARDYKAEWAEWNARKQGLPPRRDIQLDALAAITDGKMLIHCHSYRQDEVLMLMRLTEEFGFRVNTFTHILEGYKVADEIATHGASAVGFSDWWGYKFEVIDAIPYSGYIMWDRGVNTGFNSDDSELARRLNTEATKAIKYGGVPPEEAIKFVTLNPARTLKIDDRVGSLVVGKDADFSIWNGSPLSPYSACQQTWIEGRKYFDRAEDLAGRAALARERDQLVARARAQKKEGPGAAPPGGRRNWPPRYLEDTDMSGTDCGLNGHSPMPFMSETARRAQVNGEVQR
jgi:imidazolonepropionase-like amidohydrolase